MLLRTSLAMSVRVGAVSFARRSSRPTAGVTALTHVRVIDGTGSTPLEDATVLIEGNRIMAIQSADCGGACRARVLDLHGDTVMPGLINAHGIWL